jgi:hypothetical protein
MKAKGSSN